MPFPFRLRKTRAGRTVHGPLAWGINGVAAVTGSITFMAIASVSVYSQGGDGNYTYFQDEEPRPSSQLGPPLKKSDFLPGFMLAIQLQKPGF